MKKILVMLLALTFLFAFAACGGNEDPGTNGGQGGDTQQGAVFPDKVDYSYIRSENGSTDHAQSKKIDADLGDWTDEEKANCISLPVEGGHNLTVYAVKKADGIYVAYDVTHAIIMKSSRDPRINTNVSFTLGDGVTRYVSIDDVAEGVTDYAFESQKKEGENRHTVFEIFIAKENVENFDGTVYGGFSFKDQEVKDFYWGFGGKWSWYDNSDTNASLLITENGLVRPGNAAAEEVEFDGDPSEDFWDDIGGKGWIRTEYNYNGYFEMNAVLKDDGVYVAFMAEHTDNANYPRYWCYNTNFEIKIGSAGKFSHHIISMYEQTRAITTISIKEGNMITLYDDELEKYMTFAEVFIPYESCVEGASVQSQDLFIGASFRADAASSQAVGAMVWTPLYYGGLDTWGMNVLRVTSEGLAA